MTATNHALVGATIAAVLKEPILVIPAAFASHFVLDVFPHFGFVGADVDPKPLKKVLFADACTMVLLVLAVALLCSERFIIYLGMFAAISPDFVWAYRFWQEKYHSRSRTYRMNPLTKFHAEIQWGERPWAWTLEIVYGCIFASIFYAVAT